MTDTAIIGPDEISRRVSPIVQAARAIQIRDANDYEDACSLLLMIAEGKKEVDKAYDDNIHDAFVTHKNLCAKKKTYYDPLVESEKTVKARIAEWSSEQERIRREQENAQAAALKQQQDERAVTEAKQLEAAGQPELAAIVRQTAEQQPAPVVVLESPVPKVSGVTMSHTDECDFVIEDERKLFAEVIAQATKLDGEARYAYLRLYLMPNVKGIRDVVDHQKKLTRIPGVRVFPKPARVNVRTR